MKPEYLVGEATVLMDGMQNLQRDRMHVYPRELGVSSHKHSYRRTSASGQLVGAEARSRVRCQRCCDLRRRIGARSLDRQVLVRLVQPGGDLRFEQVDRAGRGQS